MLSLTYYSHATCTFNEDDLYRLAAKAHKKNKQVNITGFLQFKKDHFLQYLEGEKEDILTLIDTLKKDPRHEITRIVYLEECDSRRFSNWHMRYWKESEFSYFKLADLLDHVLQSMSPQFFNETQVRNRTTKLVNLISEHQQLLKDLEGKY